MADPQLNVVYKPSQWQQLFHSLPHDEALGGGARGPGKSQALLLDPLQQIQVEHDRCAQAYDHPFPLRWGSSRGTALLLRRTMGELRENIKRSHEIFPILDPGAKWRASESTWFFSSGYQYRFGHAHQTDDWSKYLGFEFSWIGYDELVTFDAEHYDQINTSLRSADPVLGNPELRLLKVRSCTNPVTIARTATIKNPQWVRERFVDPAPQGKTTLVRTFERPDGTTVERTSIFLPATLYDNPNPQFVKQYEATLLNTHPALRRALLYGDWYVTAQSFFSDVWDPRLHTRKPHRVPFDSIYFRSMDWGYRCPGYVTWWALDEEDTLYCLREHMFVGKEADQVAKEVRAIEIELGLWDRDKNQSKITGPSDPQIYERRGELGPTKAATFASLGVGWIPADKTSHSRARHAQRIYARLKDRSGEYGTGRLVIFDSCRALMKAIPSVQIDQNNPEAYVDNSDDHVLDTLAYATWYASLGRQHISMGKVRDPNEYEKDWPTQADEFEEWAIDRGRYGYGSSLL